MRSVSRLKVETASSDVATFGCRGWSWNVVAGGRAAGAGVCALCVGARTDRSTVWVTTFSTDFSTTRSDLYLYNLRYDLLDLHLDLYDPSYLLLYRYLHDLSHDLLDRDLFDHFLHLGFGDDLHLSAPAK